jgi:hypothetical protein
MKYRIGTEKSKPEPEVSLTFNREPDGSVNVMANDWYILTFEIDGRIQRCACVPPDLGFQVDKQGHVKTIDEK